MKFVKSDQIASAIKKTGEQPVLILCSDDNEYYCKYAKGSVAQSLFNEYLSLRFLELWDLTCADFAFVHIDKKHVPVDKFNLPNHYFDQLCFGSKYNDNYQDITKFTEHPDKKRTLGVYTNRLVFLKIALFDLWIANEDRTQNNYNLMVDTSNNNLLIPIDHTLIFNSNANGTIELLDDFSSLTNTELKTIFVHKKDFTHDFVNELENMFYSCTAKCKDALADILIQTPECWNIDLSSIEVKIKNELFSAEWEKLVFKTFLTYLESPFQTTDT